MISRPNGSERKRAIGMLAAQARIDDRIFRWSRVSLGARSAKDDGADDKHRLAL